MLRKLVLRVILSITGVQALLVVALVVADSLLRRRGQHADGFPSVPHPDIKVEYSLNTLKLYSTGDELYSAMFDAIEHAEHTIFLETYIWKGDEIGRRFVSALERKAREGVAAYVIFDWFANLVVPRMFVLDKTNAFELKLAEWARRPVWARAIEHTLQSLAPLV